MTLKFYISVAKELKLKARNLKKELIILTLGEVTGEKPVEGVYAPILNRVNIYLCLLSVGLFS